MIDTARVVAKGIYSMTAAHEADGHVRNQTTSIAKETTHYLGICNAQPPMNNHTLNPRSSESKHRFPTNPESQYDVRRVQARFMLS